MSNTPEVGDGSLTIVSAAGEAFNRLVRVAGTVLRAPGAFISVASNGRQQLQAAIGLPAGAAAEGIPLSEVFATRVSQSDRPVAIADLQNEAERAVAARLG